MNDSHAMSPNHARKFLVKIIKRENGIETSVNNFKELIDLKKCDKKRKKESNGTENEDDSMVCLVPQS